MASLRRPQPLDLSILERERERLLERLDDPAQEADRVGAVDDAMVVAEATAAASAAARTAVPFHTGSNAPREMPRIATSGQLTIGVNAVPPMPPRFVIDIEPPDISSSDSLRALRLLGQLLDLDRELR